MSVTASFLNFAGAAGLPPTATPGGKAAWCPLPPPLAEDRGEDRGNNGDFSPSSHLGIVVPGGCSWQALVALQLVSE